MDLSIAEVIKATGGKLLSGNENERVSRVCHNSAEAKEGDLFFAFPGERHDGHEFIPDAASKGCGAFVASRPEIISEMEAAGMSAPLPAVVLVENTLKAIADLAAYYLSTLNMKIVAVTGSTGKTSTKDMTAAVLSVKYKTGVTKGNFNNDLGLPLTVLGFSEDMEAGVLEMGMDHAGEIDYLCGIAKPDVALITNIGISHMENLGSREGIFKAKMEIAGRLNSDDALIISEGPDFLRRENTEGDYQLVVTGPGEDCDYRIEALEDKGTAGIEFDLTNDGRRTHFTLHTPGRHNALNAALAVAAGEKLGITMEEAAGALSGMAVSKGRLTVKEYAGMKLIDDTYNASPDSMKAALNVLEAEKTSAAGKRTAAVLGDMLELGTGTETRHEEVGRYAKEKQVDLLFCYGELAKNIAAGYGEGARHFDDMDELCRELAKELKPGDVVIFKGSRGMKMERALNYILENGAEE